MLLGLKPPTKWHFWAELWPVTHTHIYTLPNSNHLFITLTLNLRSTQFYIYKYSLKTILDHNTMVHCTLHNMSCLEAKYAIIQTVVQTQLSVGEEKQVSHKQSQSANIYFAYFAYFEVTPSTNCHCFGLCLRHLRHVLYKWRADLAGRHAGRQVCSTPPQRQFCWEIEMT